MSALTLTLKKRPDQRLDMSPLVCQKLKGRTPVEIGEIELPCGNRQIRVNQLFKISGNDVQHIIIAGSFNKLDYIGKELEGGKITVEGDAGAYLGQNMKSGTINVQGDAGLYTGCEMKDGLIEIDGNAGDFLGGALPGNKQGMQGGTILVKGNVGERAGDHMRRGLILIEGNAGDYCGSRMVAGTIAIMGQTGRYLGYAMRRGTLLLWNKPQILPTFNDCGSHTLAFLPILFSSFKKFNSRFADASVVFNRVQRYGGDMASTGKGEILLRLE